MMNHYSMNQYLKTFESLAVELVVHIANKSTPKFLEDLQEKISIILKHNHLFV